MMLILFKLPQHIKFFNLNGATYKRDRWPLIYKINWNRGTMIEKTDFVCINVATNEGRRTHMKELAEQRGIPLRFFEAITPQTVSMVPSRYSRRRAQFWWGRELMPTEQACGLSHIKIWRDFMVSEDEYLVVFEDDLSIEADCMDVVKAVLSLPVVPDFIKFSGQHERPSKPVCKVGGSGLRATKLCGGTD
jgi:hypothetical protein